MPPSRRHSRTTTPPVRRPRVAGQRRPGTPEPKPRPEPESPAPPEPETTEPRTVAVEAELPARPEPEPEPASRTMVFEPVIGVESAEPVDVIEEERPPARRPAGKHRDTGITRPDDLAEAETQVDADPEDADARAHRNRTIVYTSALVVLTLLLAGLAVWFRGEANSRTEGADVNNRALTDPATQSELVRQVRTAIEKTLSYNYTDLDSTARAVRDSISGKAQCEYDQLFGEVRKLAPEQKIVLTTQVRDIGVTRLEGDLAQLLVFVDQRTTRTDQNQTTASGAQFGIRAERQGETWKITEFDMLGQPLPNGKPAPQC